jgi:hypothetical protein
MLNKNKFTICRIWFAVLTWVCLAILFHVTIAAFFQGNFSSQNILFSFLLSVTYILHLPGMFCSMIWPGVHAGVRNSRVAVEIYNDVFYLFFILMLMLKIKIKD